MQRSERSRQYIGLVLALLTLALVPRLAVADVMVIAHRGASGYLPEHTLAAYERAIDMGADYIEPDLVFTRDGVLIARHDHFLSTTTDVADRPVYADRRRVIDGRNDWFTEDFTLAEIKTLRARQAFPGRNTAHDGEYPIPTLREVYELAQWQSIRLGRPVGLYPETKVPSHFEAIGYNFEAALLDVLGNREQEAGDVPVIVQSFEPAILKRLDANTDFTLVQLLRPVSRAEPGVPNIPLEQVAAYADGVGALKVLIAMNPSFVKQADVLNLFVHAWTFRDDAFPVDHFDSPAAEIRHYVHLGIDGLFTDFPDTAVRALGRE